MTTLTNLTLHLRDRSPDMVAAWNAAFSAAPGVRVSYGSILDERADAIVSPANSFGFMDGGVDLAYSAFFGWGLQDRLQAVLRRDHDCELPVGQALVLPTENAEIPFLICAPTMPLPIDVAETSNAYIAFRAALRAIRHHNQSSESQIQSVLSPGFCTGFGHMPAERSARQMRLAYDSIVLGDLRWASTAGGIRGLYERVFE